jgi:hypothetical protein
VSDLAMISQTRWSTWDEPSDAAKHSEGRLETNAFDSFQDLVRAPIRHEVGAGGLEDETP